MRSKLKEKKGRALKKICAPSLSDSPSAQLKNHLTSRVPFSIFQHLDTRDGAERREERRELGLRGVVGELFFFLLLLLWRGHAGEKKNERPRKKKEKKKSTKEKKNSYDFSSRSSRRFPLAEKS